MRAGIRVKGGDVCVKEGAPDAKLPSLWLVNPVLRLLRRPLCRFLLFPVGSPQLNGLNDSALRPQRQS